MAHKCLQPKMRAVRDGGTDSVHLSVETSFEAVVRSFLEGVPGLTSTEIQKVDQLLAVEACSADWEKDY